MELEKFKKLNEEKDKKIENLEQKLSYKEKISSVNQEKIRFKSIELFNTFNYSV